MKPYLRAFLVQLVVLMVISGASWFGGKGWGLGAAAGCMLVGLVILVVKGIQRVDR